MTIDELATLLAKPKRTSRGGLVALCPAHEDRERSLSVDAGRDGRILVKCFAGCTAPGIAAALGLEMHDLFANDDGVEAILPVHERLGQVRFEIRDVDRSLRAIHVRIPVSGGRKKFIWKRPNGADGLDGIAVEDLPLYGIHRLGEWPGDTVLLGVEGEKATDAVTAAGFCAVGTVTGASGTPSRDVLAALAGRAVLLWPDNDDAGRAHMKRIAAILDDIAAVGIVDWPDAPPKGDAADYLMTHTAADMAALLATAHAWNDGETPATAEPAIPARATAPQGASGPPWPAPLTDALYGLAGDFVRAASPYSEADHAVLLLSFLPAAGAAVGADVAAMAGDAEHPARVNVVVAGDTSKGRKGSGLAPTRSVLRVADPAFEARSAGGLSSGEGLIYHVRDAVEALQWVGRGKDRHQEMVVVDEGVDDKRLLIVESEFGSVLRVLERDGNTLSPVVRLAWDTGTLRTLTRNNPLVATGAHVVLIGQITREELVRYLDRTDLASGFANRFLFVAARRAQLLPDSEAVPAAELAPIAERLRSVIEWARTPRRLRRDETAAVMWREVYPGLSGGRPGLLGAATNRAEAQVLRLSVLYAILDQSEAITGSHLLAALDVWRYCDESAYWVFGDAVGDPTADTIIEALRAREFLTRNDIRDLFQRHVSSARVAAALTTLLNAGRISVTTEETGGRPREVYRRV